MACAEEEHVLAIAAAGPVLWVNVHNVEEERCNNVRTAHAAARMSALSRCYHPDDITPHLAGNQAKFLLVKLFVYIYHITEN